MGEKGLLKNKKDEKKKKKKKKKIISLGIMMKDYENGEEQS